MMYQKLLFPILTTAVLLAGLLTGGNALAETRGYNSDNRMMKRVVMMSRATLSNPDSTTRRYQPRTRSRVLSSPRLGGFSPAYSRQLARRRCSANDVIFRIQQKYKRRGGRVVSIRRGRGGFWVTLQTRRGRVKTFFVRCRN